MKKILVNLALFVAVMATYGQQPVHIYTPRLMAPGNWYMVGTWDSTNACYADTLGYYMEGDTVKIWSNKILWINGNTIQPNLWKLTGNKLEPVTATNYINTDSSYYIKGIDFIRYNPTLKNQAVGELALYSNTTGRYNTANGYHSLHSNTTGNGNTANGKLALFSNTTGNYNTANGYHSLYLNTTGNYNTANGYHSLYLNTTGNGNTANGMYSLFSNTTGNYNTANGYHSLYLNTTDSNNIALGYNAGYDATLSNRLWIGQGDSNAAIIYGEMLTRPRIRINGELFATTIKTTITSDTLTDGTPTEAEINAALGLTPATATRGATYIIQDADGTLLIYDVISDGTYWHYVARTKAL